MKKILISYLIFTYSSFISSQQLDIVTGQADLSNFPNVCIDVTVSDSLGQVVTGITSEMVSILEDSVPSPDFTLNSLRDSKNNVSIVVAVDASLSMRGDAIENVKASLKNFIKQLSNEDQLSIMTFHNDVDIVSEFTSDKDTLLSSVDKIKAIGTKTELYYGIFSGLKQLSENDTINNDKILIVLSDGKNDSKVASYTDNDCIEKANQERIPIYSIGFHSKVEAEYLRVLERIADKTGGVYNNVKSAINLNLIYEKVFNQIQGRYSLCFNSISTQNDSVEHIVTLFVKNGQLSGETNFLLTSPETKSKNWLIIGSSLLFLIIISSIIIARNRKAQKEEEDRLVAEQKRLELENEAKKGKRKPKEDESTEIHVSSDPRETIIAGQTSFQPLQFVFESGPLKGNSHSIEGVINIGRGNQNNIVLDEKTVSTNHCKITVEHGDFFIEDLKSTNGTKVNGVSVEKVKIKSGDRIVMGAVGISVR